MQKVYRFGPFRIEFRLRLTECRVLVLRGGLFEEILQEQHLLRLRLELVR